MLCVCVLQGAHTRAPAIGVAVPERREQAGLRTRSKSELGRLSSETGRMWSLSCVIILEKAGRQKLWERSSLPPHADPLQAASSRGRESVRWWLRGMGSWSG